MLYIARAFVFHLVITTGTIALICFLGTLTETARRLTEYGAGDEVATIIKMALFQTPNLIEIAFPFIFLISAISCFFSLTRRHELDAVRVNGISAWVFLTPVLIIAFLSGLFVFTVYNPVSAMLNTEYGELRAIYIKRKPSLLAIADSGIWLKQGNQKNHSIVHAESTGALGKQFSNVIIFLYQDKDTFVGRLDAQKAKLDNKTWHLQDVWITNVDGRSHFVETYEQPTDLTPEHVYDSVAPPQTVSFWDLEKFITLAKRAGLAVPAYEFHWFVLLSMPFFLMAMTLLGAATTFFFSNRQGREIWLITCAIFSGFAVYTLMFFGRKISVSPETPIMLVALAPALLAFIGGVILFLQKEES